MQQTQGAVAAGIQESKRRAAVTFVYTAIYVTLSVALVRLTTHILPGVDKPLFSSVATLALLAGGLLWIAALRVPELRPLSAVGFVRRPSAAREAGLGAALGWAVGALLVLPAVLTLHLHTTLAADGFHLGESIGSTMLLLLFVLGRQLVLCGLPFRSLAQATSPLFASVAFSGVVALLTVTSERGDAAQAIMAAMVQLLLCTAAARTRSIWLGGALQWLWAWSVTVLFGVPSFLWPQSRGVVQTVLTGPRWATGDGFGPEAALWAGAVVVLAFAVLWRLTRDYAWHYTFDPIEGAGYAMDVAPPAEHTRMEQQGAQRPVPLVQIGTPLPQVPPAAAPDTSR